MSLIKKLFAMVFLVITLVSLGYFGKEVFRLAKIQNASDAEKLHLLWSKDLDLLSEQNKLHPSWGQIREVVLTAGTAKSRDWIQKIASPINVNPNGDHRLEVLVLSWEDSGKEGAIVQYNLVDLKSGNMIWELGRTFILKQPPKSLEEKAIAPASASDKPSQEPSSSPAEADSQ